MKAAAAALPEFKTLATFICSGGLLKRELTSLDVTMRAALLSGERRDGSGAVLVCILIKND